MAAASGMVRADRAGRSAGRGCRAGREPQALSLPRPAARAQSGGVHASDRTLARPVQRLVRRAALRLDQYLFRERPAVPEGDKRRYGHSRDHRRDCVQVIIALVVTPEGFPFAYEVLPGNTKDDTTLRGFLDRIERQYGKARRIWLMDRGVPTEAVLAEMRAADPPVQYLVGTPKGRLTRLEKALLATPWQDARPGVQVKLLPQDGELYVFAQSAGRVAKDRAMRRRQLKWLWGRLKQLAGMKLSREELLMRLGAARKQARTAWRLITIAVAKDSATFSYRLDRDKLRRARRREGRYLLRTNLTDDDPARLWGLYTAPRRRLRF